MTKLQLLYTWGGQNSVLVSNGLIIALSGSSTKKQ